MYENCLNIVQVARGDESVTPLVLLHDGGGTIISYHALGPLNRPVYAMSNPKFDSSASWEGGIPEMARAYAEVIKSKLRGDILLGGWSFGGFLALEISHLLAQDDCINVTGLLLIDSPYPELNTRKSRAGVMHLPELPSVRPQLRRKIYSSLQHSKTMVIGWQPPKWDACMSCEDCQGLKKPLGAAKSPVRQLHSGPPPAILLRADRYLKANAGQSKSVALVDLSRQDPMLGWNAYEQRFIQAVWDVPGDHHSIFNPGMTDTITEKIKNACEQLSRETAC